MLFDVRDEKARWCAEYYVLLEARICSEWFCLVCDALPRARHRHRHYQLPRMQHEGR